MKMLWSRWIVVGLVREVGSKASSASMKAGRGRLSADSCWLVVQKLFENCLALTRARLLRKTPLDI